MNAAFDVWVERARQVPLERVIEQRGIRLKGKTERVGPCPVCGAGTDRFAVNIKKQVFNCRQCGVGGDVIALVEHLDGVDFVAACTTLTGEPPPPKLNGTNGKDPAEAKKIIAAKFEYQDENGATAFVVERVEYRNADGSFVTTESGKRKKTFRQRRPDPERPGKWLWNVDGVAAVPYRLPQLVEAVATEHTIFVVEGEAKVELLRSWNVPATCCSMGAGKWRPEHSEFLRGADVVVAPDNDDAGRDHADIVASALQNVAASVRVLDLPGLPPKGDIVDWRDRGGTVEQLHELVAREAKPWAPDEREATKPPEPDPVDGAADADRFKVEMLDDIELADDPVELVQGLLPMGPALGVGYGPPKTLKSFLFMHLGMHVADFRPYCGRAVQGGAVVYVTSEGIRGVRRRLIAMRRAMGIEGLRRPFVLVSVMPNLGAGEGDRVALQQKIFETLAAQGITAPLRMIVIDTFRRSMPGKSENEQKDVSIVVDNCEALGRAFDCLVMLAHHSPRSDDTRTSGSNALDAAADLMISVIRPDGCPSATATVVRYKDGEEGDAWTFELRPAEIGIDREGNPIMSCSVEVTAEPARKIAAAKSSPLSPAQQRVFDIVLGAVADSGVAGLAGEAAPPGTRAVDRETLKAYAKTSGWWDEEDDKSSRTRFAARLNELAGKRVIGLTAAHVWPARRAQ